MNVVTALRPLQRISSHWWRPYGFIQLAFAWHHGGTYLPRIEDTDKARSTDAARRIHEGLNWLGLAATNQRSIICP